MPSQKPGHLVVGGLPAHKTKLEKDYVASTNERLTLHFLRGYAPELHSNDLVWRQMNRTGIARKSWRKGEQLRETLETQLATLKNAPHLFLSFFKAPNVVYIIDW